MQCHRSLLHLHDLHAVKGDAMLLTFAATLATRGDATSLIYVGQMCRGQKLVGTSKLLCNQTLLFLQVEVVLGIEKHVKMTLPTLEDDSSEFLPSVSDATKLGRKSPLSPRKAALVLLVQHQVVRISAEGIPPMIIITPWSFEKCSDLAGIPPV